MTTVPTWLLRARFAESLSALYGREVPAYLTLVDVATQVNAAVVGERGDHAERLGSIERVTAERHGAIRVGSVRELAQVAQVFAGFGMLATGFYDLRDAAPQPIPVVSTAFRPHDRAELARNPFRVFTSMLVPWDRRFFDAHLERRLCDFIDARELFGSELLELAAAAETGGGLPEPDASRYLDLAAGCFALSGEPVERAWYDELATISGVAADIGGVAATHINHLTPRVLDIEALYAGMRARDIAMIEEIQGPPGGAGPDVLLRQTSFRALGERRVFREPDGTIGEGELRVRFGEVEQRGIALTPAGRARYDDLLALVDARLRAAPTGTTRSDIAEQVWGEHLPSTEAELDEAGLGYFTYEVADGSVASSALPDVADARALVAAGVLRAEPIVYEDFLPRSAAGIFASNLSDAGSRDVDQGGAKIELIDLAWLADAIGRPIAVPEELYEAQRRASLESAARALGMSRIDAPAGAAS